MHLRLSVSLPLLLTFALFLTGCATSFDPFEVSTPPKTSVGAIRGVIHGGQQPVVGAHLFMFAVGTGGYAGNGIAGSGTNVATSLLTSSSASGYTTTQDMTPTSPTYLDYYVTTGPQGDFSLGGEYTCTQNTQVYLYGVGGNPGAGANSASGFMAVLGNCPGTGTLSTQVPTVYMNEVSTIAAAYALAGFATDPVHISSSNTALAKTGVANAAANAGQIYTLNTAPSSSARSTTPGNGTNGSTGSVPNMEIDTLANILASCVNSTGPASSSCTTLFRNATSDGITCATTCTDEPSDTAAAAINIAHHPATNVSTLYGLVGATAAPFTPALTSTPIDFAVRLTFTGGGITSYDGQPQGLAVDGSGNLWSVGYFGTVLSKFNPLGVPANTSGYALSLNGPGTVALDANSTHVWIADFATGAGDGGIKSYNIAAATTASYGAGGNAATGPIALGIDGSGNVWISNYDGNEVSSNVVKMSSSGNIASTVTQASVGNKITSPTWMAFEPGLTGNTWIANEDANGAALFSNSGAYLSSSTVGSQDASQAVAIDASGNAWFTNLFGTNLSKSNAAGTSGSSYVLTSAGTPSSVAIDGAGNVWAVANASNNPTDLAENSVYELNNSGVAQGPAKGYVPSPTSLAPGAVVVDGSGNVWYQTNIPDGSNTTSQAATLVEMVGIGVPVATPLSYAVANSLLGTRP